MNRKYLLALLLLLPVSYTAHVIADVRGNVRLESRYYFESGDQGQEQQQHSIVLAPEFFTESGNSLYTFAFHLREDSQDDERSHFDIRELSWVSYGDDWEIRAGISKVFWGVAESQHLVDIINQTDAVENVDGEDKLGQPMVNVTLMREWGNLEFFLLPYFRERTFAGIDGRFRAPIRIDTDLTTYASSDEDKRIDGAIRWASTLGDWDVGIAHFSGTSREPRFNPLLVGNEIVLAPHYTTIDQTSIDLQATIESWLWKLEMISNSGFDLERYTAAVAGFEYSFYDVAESGIDIGLIMEYQYDSRNADYAGNAIEDSIVIGSRFAWNDEQSTELLVGAGFSEEDGVFWNIEGSRRIGQNWKVTLEGRIISGVEDTMVTNPFYAIRNDSFIQLELVRYF